MTLKNSASQQMPLRTLLRLAAEARRLMHEGASLTSALERTSASLPVQGRAALQSILYDAVRRQAFAHAAAGRLLASPPPAPVERLIEIALALLIESRYSDFTLVNESVIAVRSQRRSARFSGLVNAVLRRFLREKEALAEAVQELPEVRFNAPAWWIERVRANHPDHWEEILRLGTLHAPMTLRVNIRKTSPEAYLEKLSRAGIAADRVGRFAVCLSKPRTVSAIPGFSEGEVSVQDAGTQLAAEILAPRPDERILDACAAPGGKTAHLLETADCRLTALEIDPTRARLIGDTLSRLGLSAEIRAADAARVNEWWSGEPFDAILLDAPCTASGIVRRQPDVPWSRRPDDPEKLAIEQHRLLEALWPCLRTGGRMLFCTCSIFPEEGREQIIRFAGEHPDARLTAFAGAPAGMMSLIPSEKRTWLPEDSLPSVHDGFFYALLTKH